MSDYDEICDVCYNFKYECVCPKELPADVVDLTPKKPTPAKPRAEKPMIETEDDAAFIKMYEEKYPAMTTEFKRICSEQYITFCKKNHNYGTSNIAMGTNLENADDIKLSLSGLWFRLFDKCNRLKQLVVLGNSDKVGESSADSFGDLSVYGIIAQIIQRGKWGK